jgi:hypothetical protein
MSARQTRGLDEGLPAGIHRHEKQYAPFPRGPEELVLVEIYTIALHEFLHST